MANLNRVQVLIVDDNAHMLYIVRTMLRGFGIAKIFDTRDAAEALNIGHTEAIDIIIADYQMDMLDGLELTRLIRTADDSANRYVPIIMLTAYTERSRIMAMRDAGVTEICAKPINATELWRKIAEVVNNPRPFVKSKAYFGPDRRRRNPDEYQGDERRQAILTQRAAALEAASAEQEDAAPDTQAAEE